MQTGTAASYTVFVRNWWRWANVPNARSLPGLAGKVPDPGARKTTIAKHCTEEEALAICERYAQTHKPGPLSRKAEYTRED